MDIYEQADVARAALPHRGGVVITGDGRVIFWGGVEDVEVAIDRIGTIATQEILAHLMELAYRKGRKDGETGHKAIMRERLGL